MSWILWLCDLTFYFILFYSILILTPNDMISCFNFIFSFA